MVKIGMMIEDGDSDDDNDDGDNSEGDKSNYGLHWRKWEKKATV